jgi:hypothetical protein
MELPLPLLPPHSISGKIEFFSLSTAAPSGFEGKRIA